MQVETRFDDLDILDKTEFGSKKELIESINEFEQYFDQFFPTHSLNWRISYESDSNKYRVDFKVNDYGWGY